MAERLRFSTIEGIPCGGKRVNDSVEEPSRALTPRLIACNVPNMKMADFASSTTC
jgi:hypothetical protein